MLSPPSIRWSPTPIRVSWGLLPSAAGSTWIRVRSVVPPPTSHTSTRRDPAQFVRETVAMAEQPVVEGRLRLFEQAQAGQAGQARGLHGECARAFVEGGRHGEHDVLRFQRRVGKDARSRLRAHGPDSSRWPPPATPWPRLRRRPRAGWRRAVHAGCDSQLLALATSAPRHLGAELARESADDCGRRAGERRVRPRQAQAGGVEFAGGGVVAQRRQQRARRDLAAADELVDLEQPDAVVALSGEGDDGVAGAEVDADGVARHGGGRLTRR
jgi:hypothetical protein